MEEREGYFPLPEERKTSMFWSIINTDNDVVAQYDTEMDATEALAQYNDEYTVVEHFPYFYDVDTAQVAHRVKAVRDWSIVNEREAHHLAKPLERLGLDYYDVIA